MNIEGVPPFGVDFLMSCIFFKMSSIFYLVIFIRYKVYTVAPKPIYFYEVLRRKREQNEISFYWSI